MALIPKQRSTSNVLQNIMNQPVFQRAMQRGGTVGRDKRAVGAQDQMLGGFVRQERQRLAKLDEAGYQLAGRRERLGWQRQIASKRDALVARRMKSQEEQSKLAMTLGAVSTVASGFGAVQGWRSRRAGASRQQEIINLLRQNKQQGWRTDPGEEFTGYE